MHAAEVLLLFPDPLGIDIPALQTCLDCTIFGAEMNVLKKVCTMHSQCTMHFSSSFHFCTAKHSSCLSEFGTARGHLCADVLQTAYVSFSRLTRCQKTKPIETIQAKDFKRLETVLKKSAEK